MVFQPILIHGRIRQHGGIGIIFYHILKSSNLDLEYMAYADGHYHNSDGPVKIQKTLADSLKEAVASFITDVNANWTLGYNVINQVLMVSVAVRHKRI